jgi:hypothetical protein
MGSASAAEFPLWMPKSEDLANLRLEKFRARVNEKYGLHLGIY